MSRNIFNSLQTVSPYLRQLGEGKSPRLFANNIQFFDHSDDKMDVLNAAQVVLLGVLGNDELNSINAIRESFYKLYLHSDQLRMVDIGDLECSDNDSGLRSILNYLHRSNIFVIVLGSNPSISKQAYLSLENEMEKVSISCVTPSVSMSKDGSPSFLSQLLEYNKHKLFDLNILAHQQYLSDPDVLDQFTSHYFQTMRLGVIRNDILSAEPMLRDSDIFLLDMSAVRSSDAPLAKHVGPNGLYSEEACQLARLAGLSDNLKVAAVSGFYSEPADNGSTAQLIAQLIWHLLDGFMNRKHEDLLNSVNTVKKIIVNLDAPLRQLHFYHSDFSDRWWMEIPCEGYVNGLIFACSIDDYRTACNHEVPMRWVWFHQKLFNRTNTF